MAKKLTRGEKVIAFIEKYLRVPEGEHIGKKLKLEDFQKKFILDVYDNPHGTKRGILSTARKNGKTGLIAALLLAHVAGPEALTNTQIVSGALSREQAALVFDLACKMVNQSPELRQVVKVVPSSKRLIGMQRNVVYKALAAEGKTAHGLSPVLAILDEIGQVTGSHDAFIEAIKTSQGAHKDPLLLAISTQAASDADLLSIWIDDAQASKDPKIVCHVYETPPDMGLTDEQGWHMSNPALGKFRSIDDLREQMLEAARMPSAESMARNLLLNQRVSINSPFISRNAWESVFGEVAPIESCTEIFGGLDLSQRNDLTALVLIGQSQGRWHVYPYFWTPESGIMDRVKRDRVPYDVWVKQGHLRTTPAATIEYDWLAHDIAKIVAPLRNLSGIAYDRWRIDILKKEFERISVDLPLSDWGQGFKDMSPALEALEEKILNKKLLHGNNPVLNMCAANATLVKNPAGDRKLEKVKNTGRIDGMVALCMAAGLAERNYLLNGTFDDFVNNPLVL